MNCIYIANEINMEFNLARFEPNRPLISHSIPYVKIIERTVGSIIISTQVVVPYQDVFKTVFNSSDKFYISETLTAPDD